MFRKKGKIKGRDVVLNTEQAHDAKIKKEKKQNKDTMFTKQMKSLKDILVCKNVNPLPDDHIQIINGRKIYSRVLYVSDMPRRSSFANTFEPIFKFGHSNVSIFVKPLKEGKIMKELNDTIVDLDAERMMAKNINRERRLSRLLQEAESLSDAVDSGENLLFEVSILTTLYADSYDELNKLTDMLRRQAREKSVILSTAYAGQKQGFLSGLPFNNNKVGYYHLMDMYSLSTLFHYTKGKFGHNSGAIIGRNMDTGELVAFNLFERAMNGYNIIISGMTRSGKSTFLKIYFMRAVKPGELEIYAVDTEGEYADTASVLNGVNIEINNNNVINPFDIDIEYMYEKNTGQELPYLDLVQKINDVTYNILTMARGNDPDNDLINDITLNIIKDTVKEIYSAWGYVHNDLDSYYTVKGGIKMPKTPPTLGDWYKHLCDREVANRYQSPSFITYYEALTLIMKDFIRHMNGTRLYFDGQSSIKLGSGISFTNFDIHKLHEKNERPVVLSILMDWLWEKVMKKNSENPLKAKKIAVAFDETHYLLPMEEARKNLTQFYRRAAKRNVATISATQNINDYMMYEDCHAIFTNADTKILLRHDKQEKEALKALMDVTDVEADIMISASKGELYIVSGNNKAFVKLDRLNSEIAVSETDMNVKKELEMKKFVSGGR